MRVQGRGLHFYIHVKHHNHTPPRTSSNNVTDGRRGGHVCMYVCKDSAAPGFTRVHAHTRRSVSGSARPVCAELLDFELGLSLWCVLLIWRARAHLVLVMPVCRLFHLSLLSCESVSVPVLCFCDVWSGVWCSVLNFVLFCFVWMCEGIRLREIQVGVDFYGVGYIYKDIIYIIHIWYIKEKDIKT